MLARPLLSLKRYFPARRATAWWIRGILAQKVIGSEPAFKKLEAIIHPLVRSAQWRFLLAEQDKGSDAAVLEIPLLFETGAHANFDAIIVVSAPAEVQRERILARPGMTIEKLEGILSRQLPDAAKREKADYVVDTGVPLEDTYRQIDAILKEVLKRPPLAYQRWADHHED